MKEIKWKTKPIITRKAMVRRRRIRVHLERILAFLTAIGIVVLTAAVAALSVYYAIAGLMALFG